MGAIHRTTKASSISRYRFVRRIAVGGMAEVYAADAAGALDVTRRVAIKRILPRFSKDADFVRMFMNEARLAANLQHPNIVQTLDILDDDGAHLIVMELLDGLNLLAFRKQLASTGQRFTPEQALYITDRVLSGLHYAHERSTLDGRPLGVVHRDVSPHNVVITTDGAVKLVDFGVAKAEQLLDKRGTESGVVKGKVLFMSPEQCQGQDMDRRADIWSAGVLLYILLTGKAPFKGKNPYDTMRAIIHDYPMAPSARLPSITAELDAVVMVAMSKDPEQRFASARDMQRAVSDVMRRNNLHLTDVEFQAFVERLYEGLIPQEPDTTDLPLDVVIAEGGTEQVARYASLPSPGSPIAETEHAVVEREGGLTVLKLRGTLDERFDPDAIRPHLAGMVLVDSEAVTQITSYGIRGLLRLAELDQDEVQLVHVHCSVPFVQQVGMVRGILGGGKIVSFQMPYLDPENGNAFVELLSGLEAQEALARRRAPAHACPGFPTRTAEFDEDEQSYLCFANDFMVAPPKEVAALISVLEMVERQVEMAVTDRGTEVFIRRPIDELYRWRSMLGGLEGAVHIDMEATPSWTLTGVERLLSVLSRGSDSISELTLLHMPAPMYGLLSRFPGLARRLTIASTLRVHARCMACRAPRRVACGREDISEIRVGATLSTPCANCGGPLQAAEDLGHIIWKPSVQPPEHEGERSPAASVRVTPPWVGAMLGVALLGAAALGFLLLWVNFKS